MANRRLPLTWREVRTVKRARAWCSNART